MHAGVKKKRTKVVLTEPRHCTHFIIPSVEVAHLLFPIFLLTFMACDGGETVECAWGQGSALLGSESYRGISEIVCEKVNRYGCKKRRNLRRWWCLVGREACL